MATIAKLIEQIEADQRAMRENPIVREMVASIEDAAQEHKKLLEGLEVSPMGARIAGTHIPSVLQVQVNVRKIRIT